ncbi:MAG: glutamate--tRNA ligase, partial [Mucilaginibacter polytrichastri]|nr:glutamate--tRNA ligase [Mucilaginibacter polytrichastri]
LEPGVLSQLAENGVADVDPVYLEKVLSLVKDRLVLLGDFWQQAGFFFKAPETWDLAGIQPKWNEVKTAFFQNYIQVILSQTDADFNAQNLEALFKAEAEKSALKPGEVMLPLRIMLVGGKFGPGVFEIAEMIGKEEVAKRVETVLAQLG